MQAEMCTSEYMYWELWLEMESSQIENIFNQKSKDNFKKQNTLSLSKLSIF